MMPSGILAICPNIKYTEYGENYFSAGVKGTTSFWYVYSLVNIERIVGFNLSTKP